MITLAHLSDLHLDGSASSARRVERVVARLADLPGAVDAVLITGDVAESGLAGEYRQARLALEPLYDRYPVLLCPGNHDSRKEFREAFPDNSAAPAADSPVNVAENIGGVRILMCDSSVPGRAEGLLERQTLEWLDESLAAFPDVPALVALHHPPVELGVPYIDRIALRQPQDLEKILRCHDQVAAVLCGHAHTAATASFAGLPLLCAPGVRSTALLPWEQQPGQSWKTHDAPPGLSFHLVGSDRVTTHVRTV